MATYVRGGNKLKAFLRRAKTAKARSVKGVDVGYFSDARYPPVRTGKNGGQKQKPVPVAAVAAWNEFGTKDGRVPERPFIRQAIKGADKDLIEVLKENIDPLDMVLTRQTAGKMGQVMVGRIQRSITTLRTPPNAPATIRKKSSSNPLIDTGTLRQSVTYKIAE